MSELTKKRVHWKEYNGEELLHDEDVDVLTSADSVTFSDDETLQYKFTQGQFVNPSTTGILSNLSTTNKSSLVDAVNEVKTAATSNESSIGSLTNRMTTAESDIDSLETRVTPISLGGTGATTSSEALTNLGLTATATELNYVDGVTSAIQTQLDSKAVTTTYLATISTTWTGSSAPYTQTVTVNGITSNDTPIVDVVLNSNTNTALNQLEAWGCVSKITTGTNQITVTCLEDKPITAIPIQLKVVR